MTTPKAGAIPIRQGQNATAKIDARAPKTKFESVLAAAAKASRPQAQAEAQEEAQIAEAKDALGLAIVRSLLKNQKPGDIERDKAVEPEDD